MNYPQIIMVLLLALGFVANFHKCISDGDINRGMKRAYFLCVRVIVKGNNIFNNSYYRYYSSIMTTTTQFFTTCRY